MRDKVEGRGREWAFMRDVISGRSLKKKLSHFFSLYCFRYFHATPRYLIFVIFLFAMESLLCISVRFHTLPYNDERCSFPRKTRAPPIISVAELRNGGRIEPGDENAVSQFSSAGSANRWKFELFPSETSVFRGGLCVFNAFTGFGVFLNRGFRWLRSGFPPRSLVHGKFCYIRIPSFGWRKFHTWWTWFNGSVV